MSRLRFAIAASLDKAGRSCEQGQEGSDYLQRLVWMVRLVVLCNADMATPCGMYDILVVRIA